ncbi:MAG: hypothetical protein ACRCX5_14400 [Bacteroidales bacterium]
MKHKEHIDFINDRLMAYADYARKEVVSNTTVNNWAESGVVDFIIIGEDKDKDIKGHRYVILKDGENKKEKYIKRVRGTKK